MATLLSDPSVKREVPLRTRVPGFEPMFGSNCLGGPVIAFPTFGQQNYDYFYWGTRPTQCASILNHRERIRAKTDWMC